MDLSEIKLRCLFNQHLLNPTDTGTVLHDLCGIQAQYLSHAFHALRIRGDDFDEKNPIGIAKNWTIRGTMHIFSEADMPLMLYGERNHFLRPCDMLAADEYITAERKRFFADIIEQSVVRGIGEREMLKQICVDAGMTEKEEQSVFNPWGGTIRALCEVGRITHAVSEKKAFIPCQSFEPMEKDVAELELAHRYFTHYGPATIRDAAYFFGCRQVDVRRWLIQLPVKEILCNGKTYYYIENRAPASDLIPPCIFLAGFDPLMLGYKKTENPFLPYEHLRGIFSLAGIVMPAILLHGRVVGKWKKVGKKLTITMFETLDPRERLAVREEAERLWQDIRKIDGIN